LRVGEGGVETALLDGPQRSGTRQRTAPRMTVVIGYILNIYYIFIPIGPTPGRSIRFEYEFVSQLRAGCVGSAQLSRRTATFIRR
jgi:hypothetical protein